MVHRSPGRAALGASALAGLLATSLLGLLALGVAPGAANPIGTPFVTLTTVSSSANPAVVGQPVTFTAHVALNTGGAVTSGEVAFAGAGACTDEPLGASGTATCLPSVTPASVGTSTVTARYVPVLTGYSASSASLSEVVDRAATSTTLTPSAALVVVGQSVTMTATVLPTAPSVVNGATGNVSIAFANPLGGPSIAEPQCLDLPYHGSSGDTVHCTIVFPSGYLQVVSEAIYSGDAGHINSTSPTVTLTLA
jgi:hypothetical protein